MARLPVGRRATLPRLSDRRAPYGAHLLRRREKCRPGRPWVWILGWRGSSKDLDLHAWPPEQLAKETQRPCFSHPWTPANGPKEPVPGWPCSSIPVLELGKDAVVGRTLVLTYGGWLDGVDPLASGAAERVLDLVVAAIAAEG